MNPINLLTDAASRPAAIVLAVVAFALGFAVMCLLCRLLGRPCGKGRDCARKPGAKRASAEPKAERKHPAPPPGTVEIYVGNLSYDLTEEQLKGEFAAFGTVSDARIVMNRYNNRSRGYGFVQMPNRPEAEAAVAALNDKEILGRKLRCNEAKNA